VYEEIRMILGQSLDEADAKSFIKPNANAISGWQSKQVSCFFLFVRIISVQITVYFVLQNYVSRKESSRSTRNSFICPFKDRCGGNVIFRITATADVIQLEAQGEHTAESHIHDKVSKFSTIQQSSALESMVATNSMASATTMRRCLELLPDSASKISPSKARLAARAVSAVRARALQPFLHGEDLKGDEGSLTRLSSKIFLSDLVDAHNRGVKHLELHQPVCLEHQFNSGVVFGCYSTPMLLLNVPRSINTGWPVHAGFDSTFGISSKKFELVGMNVNSLRRKANPVRLVCLCIVKKEEAIAYEHMYSSMEAGVYDLVHRLKLCKTYKKCEVCDAVREQIEQGHMRDQLTPPPKPKKNRAGEEVPFKFEIPLAKPICDNTTKFSKWIQKKKPHLADKILQCAAHLTGIAWQKRSHTKYFEQINRICSRVELYLLYISLIRQGIGKIVNANKCFNASAISAAMQHFVEFFNFPRPPPPPIVLDCDFQCTKKVKSDGMILFFI
jgi:hypothetical protein